MIQITSTRGLGRVGIQVQPLQAWHTGQALHHALVMGGNDQAGAAGSGTGLQQGQGIGSELVRRLLERLKDVYMIDLLCDEAVQPFYARLGLRPASGMMQRNYDNQSGKAEE